MDIEQIRRISEAKIKAGNVVNKVRKTLKEFEYERQDIQEELADVYKPIVKAQEDVKQTIDQKPDKMLEQLPKNQRNIIQAIEYDPKMAIAYTGEKLPELTYYDTENDNDDIYDSKDDDVPKTHDKDSPKKSPVYNLDKGINDAYKTMLVDSGYQLPSEIMKNQGDLDKLIDKVENKIKRAGRYINEHSTKKGDMLQKLKPIEKTTYKRNTQQLPFFKDYLKRLKDIQRSSDYIGEGIRTYKQPKRNAYKISLDGRYGNLIIDVPKLMGQLRLIATKNNEKVLDKKVDFDTIDLLTKRFNSKKNYSDLSKIVFNELNKLSEIPIHRSSQKYSKLGSGVVYYNDVNDLIDRMELLGGSIMAGNNGSKEEFSEIVHKLYQLGKIDNNKFKDLLEVYVI